MDTMKLLLGATVAVLLGALVVSWQGMNNSVKSTPADEIARLEKQVRELKADQQNLELEKHHQAEASKGSAETEALRAQLEQAKAELEKKAADKKLTSAEDGLMAQRDLEDRDKEIRRARLIGSALLIGKVTEYVTEGNFIIFEVLMPEQVQVGVTVAIRRKTGILAQFKISDVTTEGAIANPLRAYGPIDPQPGDEIILPPVE